MHELPTKSCIRLNVHDIVTSLKCLWHEISPQMFMIALQRSLKMTFGTLLPLQDIQLCFICKYHRCDITSHNDILKTWGLITSYEMNTYTRAIFKFLRYVFVKKTILSENSLCDVMSHRWYLHMKQRWISW
jgi:hypothetical protein